MVNHSGLSDDAKTSKFSSYNFSRYNIEKLIRTLAGWIVSGILYVFFNVNQFYLSNSEASHHHIYVNNTHKNCVLLNPIQEFIETEAWLRQTFFIC